MGEEKTDDPLLICQRNKDCWGLGPSLSDGVIRPNPERGLPEAG
jgi:hypothetical protein